MPVLAGDHRSYVTQDGRWIAADLAITNGSRWINSVAGVQIGGKWGLLAQSGEMIQQPQYDEIRPLHGAFRVTDGEQVFWLDASGQKGSEPAGMTPDPSVLLHCREGLELFAENDLWGMRWVDGDVLIPARYRALWCFRDGVAWAAAEGANAWCPVGPDGAGRDHPDCVVSFYSIIWSHSYPEPFADDPHESSVLWMRALLDHGRGVRDTAPLFVGDGVQGGNGSFPAFGYRP